jgi:vacuolar-type H+-ATPase subunit E/Vma4
MGFEELASELNKSAEAEGKKLIRASERNAEKISEEAKEKSESLLKSARKEASDLARQETSERITSAKLSAKKMVDDARDEAVEAAIAQVWHKFRSDSLRKASYPSLLDRLAKEGAAEIGSRDVVLYVRDEDRGLLQGYQFRKLPAEYSGGAIVESANGKVRVNKTLEEIFAAKKPALRKAAYDRLF